MDPSRGSRVPRRGAVRIAILATVALGIVLGGQQTNPNHGPVGRWPAVDRAIPGPGAAPLTAPTRWQTSVRIHV